MKVIILTAILWNMGMLLNFFCIEVLSLSLSVSASSQFLSLCSDNYKAPWFLQYKLQPIHTNLLNSAGSGRGKWTTTVRLQAGEQQRLEHFISFRLFKHSPLYLFHNILYALEETFNLWYMFFSNLSNSISRESTSWGHCPCCLKIKEEAN